jgi:hypothetical protein
MPSLKSRVERLEKEQRFQAWLGFQRFVEGLNQEQLNAIVDFDRYPDPLPQPLPLGASELDKLDRKILLKMWEDDEREWASRSEQEKDFCLVHLHWPEQPCVDGDCQKFANEEIKGKFRTEHTHVET